MCVPCSTLRSDQLRPLPPPSSRRWFGRSWSADTVSIERRPGADVAVTWTVTSKGLPISDIAALLMVFTIGAQVSTGALDSPSMGTRYCILVLAMCMPSLSSSSLSASASLSSLDTQCHHRTCRRRHRHHDHCHLSHIVTRLSSTE